MSERALRGTRLVVTSYETDRGIDLAPRQAVEYACQNGHRFEMPFSVEAEIPPEWECKACGAQALLVDGDGPEEKKGKPARTHWDMLMERRTREELEEVLAGAAARLLFFFAPPPAALGMSGDGWLPARRSRSCRGFSAWPGSHDFHMTRVAALRPRQRRLPQDARCGSPAPPGPGSRESYRRGTSRRSRRLRE